MLDRPGRRWLQARGKIPVGKPTWTACTGSDKEHRNNRLLINASTSVRSFCGSHTACSRYCTYILTSLSLSLFFFPFGSAHLHTRRSDYSVVRVRAGYYFTRQADRKVWHRKDSLHPSESFCSERPLVPKYWLPSAKRHDSESEKLKLFIYQDKKEGENDGRFTPEHKLASRRKQSGERSQSGASYSRWRRVLAASPQRQRCGTILFRIPASARQTGAAPSTNQPGTMKFRGPTARGPGSKVRRTVRMWRPS